MHAKTDGITSTISEASKLASTMRIFPSICDYQLHLLEFVLKKPESIMRMQIIMRRWCTANSAGMGIKVHLSKMLQVTSLAQINMLSKTWEDFIDWHLVLRMSPELKLKTHRKIKKLMGSDMSAPSRRDIHQCFKHYIRKTINIDSYQRYGTVREEDFDSYTKLLVDDYNHYRNIIVYGIDKKFTDVLVI